MTLIPLQNQTDKASWAAVSLNVNAALIFYALLIDFVQNSRCSSPSENSGTKWNQASLWLFSTTALCTLLPKQLKRPGMP